ncbi:MAG: Gx transporter family protein [Mariprofundaceae bacterium]|nr:Gx transporter family protein [Mariprofundaceae bacterium]
MKHIQPPVRPSLKNIEKKAYWLGFLLLASGLHVFEAAMPNLGPWFKLGLANIITLIVLVLMGERYAIGLALGRIVIGALLLGTIFTPTFIVSLIATLAATFSMIMVWRYVPKVSLVGTSLCAALVHMGAQFWVVGEFIIQHDALYYLLPPLLLLACVTGWLNGALAHYMVAQLQMRDGENIAGKY